MIRAQLKAVGDLCDMDRKKMGNSCMQCAHCIPTVSL